MLEAGRFILRMGAVLVQTAGPSYVVEMAYPKYRGQLTGGSQACFFLGTIVSTWLEYGLTFDKTGGFVCVEVAVGGAGIAEYFGVGFCVAYP